MRLEAREHPPGLVLFRDDGGAVPLHPLWLRERSAASADLDAKTGQRLYNPAGLDLDLAILSLEVLAHERWRIAFSDGASAEFEARNLLAEIAHGIGVQPMPQRRVWTAATLGPMPLFAWGAEASMPEILAAFLTLGFVILTGVPRKPGSLLTLAREFGIPRETNFGLFFDVRSVPTASDLAYTSLALDPHTDNPYRDPVPGIQLLHCLENQMAGGASTLVDGAAVAAALRAADPEAFATLLETPVGFRYRDWTADLVETAPILEMAPDAMLGTIRYSPRLDAVPLADPETLTRFYAARAAFDRLLHAPEFEIHFLLRAGDCVMFDNRRLLHGRTEFDPQQGNRHLQGCYIDSDGPKSLYRVLKRERPAIRGAA